MFESKCSKMNLILNRDEFRLHQNSPRRTEHLLSYSLLIVLQIYYEEIVDNLWSVERAQISVFIIK